VSRLRRLLILVVALVPPLWVAFLQAPDFVMVGGVAFSPDGRALATVCYPQVPQPHAELRVWDLATGRERRADRRAMPGPRAVPGPLLTVAEGGERLVAQAVDGSTRPLADLTRWPERLLLEDGGHGVGCVPALSHDGRILATARHRADLDLDTRVRLWDVATGRLVKTLDDGHLKAVLAFSPNGHILASVWGSLVAWDADSGSVLGWSKTVAPCLTPLTFAPDGSALAVHASGGKVNLLDPADGHVRATFNHHARALAFSPDARRLAVAYQEGVTIWDLGLPKQVVRFEGHVRPQAIEHIRMLAMRAGLNRFTGIANAVWSVTFSPDGRLVASCDVDGTARVWDAATGRERLRLDHQMDPPLWPIAAAWTWAAAWGIAAFRKWGRLRRSDARDRHGSFSTQP
jgi:WD40 repeat protein